MCAHDRVQAHGVGAPCAHVHTPSRPPFLPGAARAPGSSCSRPSQTSHFSEEPWVVLLATDATNQGLSPKGPSCSGDAFPFAPPHRSEQKNTRVYMSCSPALCPVVKGTSSPETVTPHITLASSAASPPSPTPGERALALPADAVSGLFHLGTRVAVSECLAPGPCKCCRPPEHFLLPLGSRTPFTAKVTHILLAWSPQRSPDILSCICNSVGSTPPSLHPPRVPNLLHDFFLTFMHHASLFTP